MAGLTARFGCAALLLTVAAAAQAEKVLIRTPLGDIEIELLAAQAPGTVANFLNYVTDGDYEQSFIHRSEPDFVIQGGGFVFVEGSASAVPADAPIENEFGVSNTRGTVAMAKLAGDPDSATSQWFINLADNSANLDAQNGGFTVFARVLGDGMLVADAINDLQTYNAGNAFTSLPLIDYVNSTDITAENLVFTRIIRDSDADGVYDEDDAFPDDPAESLDTDGDGIGNLADPDDDGDGLPDAFEEQIGLNPLDAEDAAGDLDMDGFSNLAEYQDNTDPLNPQSNKLVILTIIQLLGGGSLEVTEDAAPTQ